MALDSSSIITTVSGTTSNSYVSLQEFHDYRDLNRLEATGFDEANSDQKIRALIMAANRLNRERWQGSRTTTTQRLAWPRAHVPKPDGVSGYSWDYSYGTSTEYFPSDTIPQEIEDAQCELALAYMDGFDDGEEDAIESFSADGVAVKFRANRPSGDLPVAVSLLISGLTVGGVELIRG